MATLPFSWPVPGGVITSPYGWRIHPTLKTRKFHGGLDFGKGLGAEIIAPADGKVIHRNDDVNNDAGRYLQVEHDNGFKTSYLHLLSSPHKVGDRVKRGELLAYMGSTGRSTGPHLHWIVRDADGSTRDPLAYVSGRYPKKGGGSMSGGYGGNQALLLAGLVVGGLLFWRV